MSLLTDSGTKGEGERWQENKEQQFEDLRDLLKERPDDRALVLLGSLGCGKSTLLHRLEYDLIFSAALKALFLNVPPPMSLAMTGKYEKAARAEIMQAQNCSKPEAVYRFASESGWRNGDR